MAQINLNLISSLINILPDNILKTTLLYHQIITIRDLLKSARIVWLSLPLVCITFSAVAGTMGLLEAPAAEPWSVTGSLGYTVYKDIHRYDGQTALGRFGISYDFYTDKTLTLGLEMGVQSGGTMRYHPSQDAIDALGGLPIQTTIQPMLDSLITAKVEHFSRMPVFILLKGGIAYRRWLFNDRDSINEIAKIAGELQAGLGFVISRKASISLSYQGIYNHSPDFRFSANSGIGWVANIPVQNGALLSIHVTV